MSYTQLKSANPNVPGQSGYCLVYVRTAFGVGAKYPTAASGWANAAYKHTTSVPTDVSVPVWFKWETSGHVAVWVPGKGVYSTTAQGVKLFPSIAACADYVGATYLGWSEDINGVRVVQPAANPAPTSNQPHGMPSVGSEIQLIPTQVRTTWKPGTATEAGTIHVTDGTFKYLHRGFDAKYPGRIIINSASGGGNGIGLALYLLNGTLVEGWRTV